MLVGNYIGLIKVKRVAKHRRAIYRYNSYIILYNNNNNNNIIMFYSHYWYHLG